MKIVHLPMLSIARDSRFLVVGALLLSLAACSSLGLSSDNTNDTSGDKGDNYRTAGKDAMYKNGSVLSDNGGLSLFGGDSKKSADGQGVGVNGYLWRATIDTISFMPIVSADPFGGIIITDWYSAPNAPNERMKLNAFILGRELRADGVRVTVFRQTRGVDNQWTDAAVSPTVGSQLEETILTRARQTRLAQKEQG